MKTLRTQLRNKATGTLFKGITLQANTAAELKLLLKFYQTRLLAKGFEAHPMKGVETFKTPQQFAIESGKEYS